MTKVARFHILTVFHDTAIVLLKGCSTLMLHQTTGNPLNYRHVTAGRIDRSIRKARPLLTRRYILIRSNSAGRITT